MTTIVKFTFVGVAGFLTDLTILTLAIKLGTGAILGRVISFTFAVLLTFILNRSITFTSKGDILKQFQAYIGASVIGLSLNWFIYYACLQLTSPQISLAFASGGAMIINFVLYRFIVFKPPLGPKP